MSFDDDQLKALFQQAADDPSEVRTEELDLERIWAAAAGELPQDEVLEVIDLCSRDPEAAEAWRLAIAMAEPDVGGATLDLPGLRAPESVSDEPVPDNVVPLFRRPSTWGAIALAAAALLAVGVSSLSPGEPEPPRYREASKPGVTSVVDGAETTPGQPIELTWTHEGVAALWKVTVSDASLGPVLTLDVSEPRAVIPAEITAAHAGEQLLWRVQGVEPDGAPRGHLASPTFTLTIAPDR